MTEFKTIRTSDKSSSSDPSASDIPSITEPILASFPQNLPPAHILRKMHFNIYQQEKNAQAKTTTDPNKKKAVRRVIKAEHKGIRYEAKAHTSEAQSRDQASDYFLALFDPKDNKSYCIPLSSAFQFTQVIERYQEELKEAREGLEEAGDNEAIKKLSYMDQKKMLADSFGTKKAIKKVTSMMTNMVDEGGITKSANKGVRDARLAQLAHNIAEDQEILKKDQLSQADKRIHLYSRDKLLPEALLSELPYKMTYEALKAENEEELQKLMINSMIRQMLQTFYATKFQHLADNHEKKFALRAFIYLDCLVAFYRLPMHIESTPEELASKLKTQPNIVEHLLSKFSQTSAMTSSRHNHQSKDEESEAALIGFKHIKSKDHVKDLICHMIGIMGILNREFRAYQVAKLIKKELNDLKSYFSELGFSYDPVKENGHDDFTVKFSGIGLQYHRAPVQAHHEAQQAAEVETTKDSGNESESKKKKEAK